MCVCVCVCVCVCRLDEKSGRLVGQRRHMNLVNLTLLLTGPLHERTLCVLLLAFQTLCCALGFFIRYTLASYVY